MARSREISTDISRDKQVAALVLQCGPLAGLLYSWAIPHADDWGRLPGDAEEFALMVCPVLFGQVEAIEVALRQIAEIGLWRRYMVGDQIVIAFPRGAWFRRQNYINAEKREYDGSKFPAPPDEVWKVWETRPTNPRNRGGRARIDVESQRLLEFDRDPQELPEIPATPSPSPSRNTVLENRMGANVPDVVEVAGATRVAGAAHVMPSGEELSPGVMADVAVSAVAVAPLGGGSGVARPCALDVFTGAFRDVKGRDPIYSNRKQALAKAAEIARAVGKERFRAVVAWYLSPDFGAADPWLAQQGSSWNGFAMNFERIAHSLGRWEADAAAPRRVSTPGGSGGKGDGATRREREVAEGQRLIEKHLADLAGGECRGAYY